MSVEPKIKFFAGTQEEGFTVFAPLRPGKDNFGENGEVKGAIIYNAEDDALAHSLFSVGAIRNFAKLAEKTWKATGDLVFAVVLGKALTNQLYGEDDD